MKNTSVLLLLGAVLVGGAGLWWSQSRSAPQGTPLAGPTASSSNATAKGEEARLEAEPGAKRGAVLTPKPAEGKPQAAPLAVPVPAPQPPVLVAGGLEAPIAVDVSSVPDMDRFELKWGEARPSELKAAYQAYSELYQMNVEGRTLDKSQQFSGEALEQLGREVAWLKERAFGGG